MYPNWNPLSDSVTLVATTHKCWTSSFLCEIAIHNIVDRPLQYKVRLFVLIRYFVLVCTVQLTCALIRFWLWHYINCLLTYLAYVCNACRDTAVAASCLLEARRCIASCQSALHQAVRLAQVQAECRQCAQQRRRQPGEVLLPSVHSWSPFQST